MFEKMVKMRNKKGFTLMELLIVVAIIAILVAISIPVFNGQLEKAREQTDIANMRSAKSLAVATYLTQSGTGYDATTGEVSAYFDAEKGTLVTDKPTAYGKGTTATVTGGVTFANYATGTSYTDKVIHVKVDTNGAVTVEWQ